MMSNDYIIQMYQKAYKAHGYSSSSLFDPKDRSIQRFMALEKSLAPFLANAIKTNSTIKLLDYGCGLGYLEKYLHSKYPNLIRYTGADIVPEFIEQNKEAYPNSKFLLIDGAHSIKEEFDLIVGVNVFNILGSRTLVEHELEIKKSISHLFKFASQGLYITFMSSYVDFKQEGAYHANASDLLDYCTLNLTRRSILDQSFLPYEFSISLYKCDYIKQDQSIYNDDLWK